LYAAALGQGSRSFRMGCTLSVNCTSARKTPSSFNKEPDDLVLLRRLTSKPLWKLLDPKLASRLWVVGTETDDTMECTPSFQLKCVNFQGDMPQVRCRQMGYSCRKGLKPRSPNQDSFIVLAVEGLFSLYGVFDGHGRKGHDVSNFIKDVLPKVLLTSPHFFDAPEVALEEAFEATQGLIALATQLGLIDATRSGSTASVILHDHKASQIITGHVGDSRCVMLQSSASPEDSTGSQGNVRIVELTQDHKPGLPQERERIERCGGQVVFDGHNDRVYGSIKQRWQMGTP